MVRTAKGYNTDAGSHVYLALKKIDGTDEIPAIVVTPGSEEISPQFGGGFLTFPVRVEAHIAQGSESDDTNPVNASDLSEALLGDILEAMLGDVWTLNIDNISELPDVGDTVTGKVSGATALVQAATGKVSGALTLRRLVGTFQNDEIVKVGTLELATVNGSVTGQGSITRVTSDLAVAIDYVHGGLDEYPDAGDLTTGVVCKFNVVYATRRGDPYNT